MAEPLLAALARRGEALTVAALPWVAPAFRAMPQVGEIVELPFAHGRLDWAARRRVAATLRGRFDIAYVLPNSIKSALLPWLAGVPLRVGYHGEGRWRLLNRRLANPADERPPMVAFYGALAGQRLRRRREAAAAARRRDAAGGARQGRARRRARSGPSRPAPSTGPPSAGRPRTTPRWRARSTPPTGAGRRPARLARRSRALRADRRRRARRLPGARRQDLAARGDGADRRGARPGEQRFGADARRRRLRRAAGGGVRLDQPAAHAAAQSARRASSG